MARKLPLSGSTEANVAGQDQQQRWSRWVIERCHNTARLLVPGVGSVGRGCRHPNRLDSDNQGPEPARSLTCSGRTGLASLRTQMANMTKHPPHKSGPLKQAARQLRQLLGRLRFCVHGRHEPSRRHVKWIDGYWFSHCRYCDVQMKRVSKHIWVVINEADATLE